MVSCRVGHSGGGLQDPPGGEVCTHRTGHSEGRRVSQSLLPEPAQSVREYYDPTLLNRERQISVRNIALDDFYSPPEQESVRGSNERRGAIRQVSASR